MHPDDGSSQHLRELDAQLCELLDLDEEAQREYLSRLPPERQQRLHGLLDAALSDDDFLTPGGALDPRLLDAVLGDEDTLAPGTRLGPWRILHDIGAGGMGRVYLAERADGLFQREVAIKCLTADSSRADPQQLQREQQLLAGLDHPNIARLYDAGVTESGAPYLVIERVDGEPIDAWCRRKMLTARQRIALLIDVCRALEAAHRQLIVHRDIKPSNILVDTDGVVKLLDFGIAGFSGDPALLSGRTTPERDGYNNEAPRGLTPRYASPEQRAGATIGTASDVYQSGLLAWELLSGMRPDAASSSASLMPDLSTLAAQDLPAADLRAVLAKAMAESPEHRYASVERLREDLQRLLSGHTVAARPAGFGYRLLRLLRRHPWRSAATVTGTLLILGMVAGFTLRLAAERDATRIEAQRALQAGAETEQVANFLRHLFRAADPFQTAPDPSRPAKPASKMTALELLDRAQAELQNNAPGSPRTRARLFGEIARLYRLLGKHENAEPLDRAAIDLLQAEPSTDPTALSDARLSLARTLALRDAGDEALSLAHEAETQYRKTGDQRRLAAALEVIGKLLTPTDSAQAVVALQESVELYRAQSLPDREADLRLFLANALVNGGRIAEARQQREQAMALMQSLHGADHPSMAGALVGLADQYQREGQQPDALPLLRRAVTIYDAQFGVDDLRTAVARNNLGNALSDLGQQEAAAEQLQQALATYQQRAPEHQAIGHILNNLGSIAWNQGDAATAADYYRQAMDRLLPKLGENHLMTGLLEANLGEALFALNDANARASLERSLDIMSRRLGDRHPMLGQSLGYLAQLDEREGKLDDALSKLRRMVAIQQHAKPADAEALRKANESLDAFLQRHPEFRRP
ncbi:MAG: serine/threonine protein kinase [Xanthomonadales bacterium]|nr:serine/threonine protein kinase [Xanthomonadales bacterium]